MNLEFLSNRGQAVVFTVGIAERLVAGEGAGYSADLLGSGRFAATQRALLKVREWQANPTVQLERWLAHTGRRLSEAARTSEWESERILRGVAACCFTAVKPAWPVWARVVSNAAISISDDPELSRMEYDYECLELAAATGRSLQEVTQVAAHANLNSFLRQYASYEEWYGPPICGRPSQIVRAPEAPGREAVDWNDDAATAREVRDVYYLRVWEWPGFREVLLNQKPLRFLTPRQVLWAASLLSTWGVKLEPFNRCCLNVTLNREDFWSLHRGGFGPPPDDALAAARPSADLPGPLLLGHRTMLRRQQNAWGDDEFLVRVWKRHHYRRLTLNGLEAVFPTQLDLEKFALELSLRGRQLIERGSTVDVLLADIVLAQLLPAGMFYTGTPASGDALLRLQRQLWARSGWLPPGWPQHERLSAKADMGLRSAKGN